MEILGLSESISFMMAGLSWGKALAFVFGIAWFALLVYVLGPLIVYEVRTLSSMAWQNNVFDSASLGHKAGEKPFSSDQLSVATPDTQLHRLAG